MNSICIVDDEQSITSTVASILKDEGYEALVFSDAESFWEKLDGMEPSLVLLDVWLPGMDGMQLLKRLHDRYPQLPVIMMSGHAGIAAAVDAIKAGAYDFLEKPLHLEVLLDKVESALKHRPAVRGADLPSDTRLEIASADLVIPAGVVKVADSPAKQRTLKGNMVLNGIGLLSGRNTGIILSPLGINEGIVYQTLDGQTIRGHITSLEDFSQAGTSKTFSANSTTLDNGRRRVRTVEHLMAVLSMYGITNVLIKVDEEIPNVDGSARDFCNLIEEAGIEEQSAPTKVAVICKKIGVGNEKKQEKPRMRTARADAAANPQDHLARNYSRGLSELLGTSERGSTAPSAGIGHAAQTGILAGRPLLSESLSRRHEFSRIPDDLPRNPSP